MRQSTKPDTISLAAGVVADLTRSKPALVLENALLRQQLVVVRRQVKRPALTWRDRAMMVILAGQTQSWRDSLLIVKPDTLLRWHRDLFRRAWRRRSMSVTTVGRPPMSPSTIRLIQRMVTENRMWGAERIRGELLKLGLHVAKSTIQKYMTCVRTREPIGQTWSTFLRNHATGVWACDFLQTHDLFFRAIFVFVIVELGSRQIVHFNITRRPSDSWAAQQLRAATAFGSAPTYLIRDNDRKFGALFNRVAVGSGIQTLRIPYRAPRANATCERFLGGLRRECLDHFLILNERQLYRTVAEYAVYFNHARPHQGIGQRIPCSPDPPIDPSPDDLIVSYREACLG